MSRHRKSQRSRLPWWAASASSLQAGPAHREAYLGDLEEAYQLRTARTGAGETGWLCLQILGGLLPWVRLRLRTGGGTWRLALRMVPPLLAAAVTLGALMTLVNQAPVLAFVRSLPEPVRFPLAGTLNLLATAGAGLVLGWCRSGPVGIAVWVGGLVGWVSVQSASAAPTAHALAWAALLSASAVWGWSVTRPPGALGQPGVAERT